MKTCMLLVWKMQVSCWALFCFCFLNWRSPVSVIGCRRSIRRSSLLISVTAMPRSARWTASPLLVMVLWSRLVSADLLVWRLWTECQNQWFLFSLVIPQCGKETPWVKEFQCCFLSKNGCGRRWLFCTHVAIRLQYWTISFFFFPSESFYILCKYFVVPFRTFEMCVQRPCHCAFMWMLPWNMGIDLVLLQDSFDIVPEHQCFHGQFCLLHRVISVQKHWKKNWVLVGFVISFIVSGFLSDLMLMFPWSVCLGVGEPVQLVGC